MRRCFKRFFDKEKVTQVKGKIVLFRSELLGTAFIGDRIYEFPLFDVRDDGEIERLGIIQMESIEKMMIEIEINDLEVTQMKKRRKYSFFKCLLEHHHLVQKYISVYKF